MAKAKAWSIHDFEIGKKLGTGRFGRVFLAKEKSSNVIVALKIISKRQLVENRMENQLRREIEIQSRLSHRNILRIFTYFWDRKHVYLVLEYAPSGELFRELGQSKIFSETKAANYVLQVANALIYLQSWSIIHRDIKPENLLNSFGVIKLSDFGWSIRARKRGTFCGTMDYLSPEMVLRRHYNHLIDNWALGVLAYEFLVGFPPFQDDESQVTYKKILNVDYSFPKYLSNEARDFISKLLKFYPEDRMLLGDAIIHPWICNNCNILSN